MLTRRQLDQYHEDGYVIVEQLLDPMEQVLGGEVYHGHHKMILKEARSGGAHLWHQDFGYWHDTAIACSRTWAAA